MEGAWYGVKQLIIHFFKASILPSCPSSINHFLQIVGQGIESIPSPKQQQRPLPSLLSLSYPVAALRVDAKKLLVHFLEVIQECSFYKTPLSRPVSSYRRLNLHCSQNITNIHNDTCTSKYSDGADAASLTERQLNSKKNMDLSTALLQHKLPINLL